MVDEQALGKGGEGPRDHVGPDDARTVDRPRHDEVAQPPGSHDVARGRRVDNDGERRTLVGAVDALAAGRCD